MNTYERKILPRKWDVHLDRRCGNSDFVVLTEDNGTKFSVILVTLRQSGKIYGFDMTSNVGQPVEFERRNILFVPVKGGELIQQARDNFLAFYRIFRHYGLCSTFKAFVEHVKNRHPFDSLNGWLFR